MKGVGGHSRGCSRLRTCWRGSCWRHARAGRRQVDREALIALHDRIAGDVDRQDLAGLTSGKAERAARQDTADKITGGGRCATGTDDGPIHGAGGGRVARASDGEGEGRGTAIAFRRGCTQGGDREGGVLIQDGAGGTHGSQRGGAGWGGKGQGKCLVRFHRCVAGDVGGDGRAGLPGREADRSERQHAAGKVRRIGLVGARAGDGVVHGTRRGCIPGARDGKCEGGGSRIAFRQRDGGGG